MVPREPVVTGESFQVQFILEDADKTADIIAPPFDHFRLVTGPSYYPGISGNHPVKNAVYTLEPGLPGNYTIPGALVVINGQAIRSNDVNVLVISRQEAAKLRAKASDFNDDIMLLPGENAQEKIKKNLFVKVSVNKNTCYVGEPVVATFKLYSRLQSKSDIIKNPGFYGFTIYDMVNLDDKMVEAESVNGRMFDVHTIRKVQLYPLQAGSFMIDPMEITNKVEFSKSAVRKKSEQEIAEGMLGSHTGSDTPEGTTVYESTLSTEPLRITVKPVPEKTKPEGYSGATGNFRINAVLVKNELAKNEEGILELIISGKGNFIQLDAPAIPWPAGVEGFAPAVRDSLDKQMLPLKGTRIFRYTFVCASPGTYVLPAISFSFFDTDSNSFRTITTQPLSVTAGTTEKKTTLTTEHKISIAAQSEKKARTALIIVVSVVLLILLWYGLRKKEKPALTIESNQSQGPTVQECMEPVLSYTEGEPAIFYTELNRGVWNYLQPRFGLTGSGMNKQELHKMLQQAGAGEETIRAIVDVLVQCETGMFTATDPAPDKVALYRQAVSLLEKIAEAR